MPKILKIYPSKEECQIQTNIACPREDCDGFFKTTSNLTFHMVNTHKMQELQPCKGEFQKQFYCPTVDCYTVKKNKHFNSLGDLRDHFLKVHAEKNVKCSKCKKGFSAVRFMKRHYEYCGVKFSCPSCKVSYDNYETLRTHCRRKKHNCPEKKDYLEKKMPKIVKHKETGTPTFLKVVSDSFLKPKKFKPILPRTPGPYLLLVNSNELGNIIEKCSQDSQTNTIEKAELVTRTTQVSKQFMVAKKTQQTQTEGNLKVSSSTQTDQEHKLGNVKRNFSESVLKQKTIDIQTDKIEICESSCNTSFKIEDLELPLEIEKSSCSTQTIKKCEKDYLYSTSTMTHDSIHTDTSDLLTEMSNFDPNFFNCNMETQTDFMLSENELFDSDFYSNMYTQTCEEILSGASNFTDIETQTVVDDVLRSVESQTLMSKIGKFEASFSNMETQTDSQFREMLEIINS